MELETKKTSQVLETCEVNGAFKVNFLNIPFYLSFLLILFNSCASTQTQEQPKADFSSSFESKNSIKQKFRLDKVERKSWRITQDEKTHGEHALKITLNKGDKSNGKTERAEFQDPEKLDLDQEVWYRLDFKIPDNFPELDLRTVIWQLKQNGGNNPLVSMRFINGKLNIKQRFSNHEIIYKATEPFKEIKGKWLRLIIQTNVSKTYKGYVNIYLNDQLIVSHRGINAYTSQDPKTYFKFGLYRNQTELPMTMFFDNYRRGKSSQEVVPEDDFVNSENEKLWPLSIRNMDKE